MKKFLSIFVLIVIITNANVVMGANLPNSFWQIDNSYLQAVASKDYGNITYFGNKEVEIVRSLENSNDKNNIMASRLNEIGMAYAKLGDYNKSADCFEEYVTYAERLNWGDGVKIAKSKILQYRSQIEVFTDGGQNLFYGSKNEIGNGVLFGSCADGPIREKTPNESIVLLYHELGHEMNGWDALQMKKAEENGTVVELALNCPRESADIQNIKDFRGNLLEISDFVNDYPNVPVYLRFAAEFDVWTNLSDSAQYIEAYRYVADLFRADCNNVSMVWSLTPSSNFYVNPDDFYPGDDYVDFVGVSAYYKKYYSGTTNKNDYDAVIFKTGVNADPVLSLKKIVETYGSRKPIIIAESGFSHYDKKASEDTTDWAVHKLCEFYNYIPMVYPQVKAILHFDKYMEEENDNYALSDSYELSNEYIKMTKKARFVQDKYFNRVLYSYKKIEDRSVIGNIISLSTYAHIYGEYTKCVNYYIDGQEVGYSNEMPFNVVADLSGFESGSHIMNVVAIGTGGTKYERSYNIDICNSIQDTIKVVLDNNLLQFDQPPILYNDRTMVPMRTIFEALGAKVEWNNASSTVIANIGEDIIKMTLGSTSIVKNGENISMDVPPMLVNDRTLVPVRAIAESLGCSVEWLADVSVVDIRS